MLSLRIEDRAFLNLIRDWRNSLCGWPRRRPAPCNSVGFIPACAGPFAFAGFELYWNRDRRGDLRVMKRTARKILQGAK
jgi:hypothetical protein